MRWDRLFAELEAQAEDELLAERDATVPDLRDAAWGGTSWRDRLGRTVRVEVGPATVEGDVVSVNEVLLHLRTPRHDVVVSAEAVTGLESGLAVTREAGPLAARLRWGPVLRAMRDAGDRVHLQHRDGASRDGVVAVVGADHLQLVTDAGRRVVVPYRAIGWVSCPR